MSREFDVIIYGASGLLVALWPIHGENLWRRRQLAMAGRNEAKLAEVGLAGAPSTTPLVTADASDSDSLRAMVKRARCICTTVGYQLYGSEPVKLCARGDTLRRPVRRARLDARDDYNASGAVGPLAHALFTAADLIHSLDLGVYFSQKQP